MLRFGFYNAINQDRLYYANDVSEIFDGIIEDGVYANVGELFATAPGNGLQVLVKTGRAWFDHTWNVNDSALPLTISTADVTRARIDAVVLEVDARSSVRENSIKVIKGTAAASPTKPALTNTNEIHQHPLAYVTVPGGATAITAANIENMVGKAECPFVIGVQKVINISDLFSQWGGEFHVWFSNIQAQLSGNIAQNLQNQINTITADIADKWNKTLSSATKTALGLSQSDTPDDAFQMINSWDAKFGVGDIRQTARSSIGEDWALCNGAVFSASAYPALANLLPASFATAASWTPQLTTPISMASSTTTQSIKPSTENFGILVTLDGDMWVLYFDTSAKQLYRAYSKSGVNSWTKDPFSLGSLGILTAKPTYAGVRSGSGNKYINTTSAVFDWVLEDGRYPAVLNQTSTAYPTNPYTKPDNYKVFRTSSIDATTANEEPLVFADPQNLRSKLSYSLNHVQKLNAWSAGGSYYILLRGYYTSSSQKAVELYHSSSVAGPYNLIATYGTSSSTYTPHYIPTVFPDGTCAFLAGTQYNPSDYGDPAMNGSLIYFDTVSQTTMTTLSGGFETDLLKDTALNKVLYVTYNNNSSNANNAGWLQSKVVSYDISTGTLADESSFATYSAVPPGGKYRIASFYSPADKCYYYAEAGTIYRFPTWDRYYTDQATESVYLSSMSNTIYPMFLTTVDRPDQRGALVGAFGKSSSSSTADYGTRQISTTLPNVSDVSGMKHFIKMR